MTPQPVAPAPGPKKRSGCFIAVMIVGGLAGLLCLGTAIAMFIAARSDTGKKVFEAFDQGVKLAEKGINAPGAAEVRALGCPQAVVMDMKDAMRIAELFIDAGLKDDAELSMMMVSCSAPYGDDKALPSCEEIATTYARAVKSEREFQVEVKRGGKQKPECRADFAPDGTFLRDARK
jgi:hypothetical protein